MKILQGITREELERIKGKVSDLQNKEMTIQIVTEEPEKETKEEEKAGKSK